MRLQLKRHHILPGLVFSGLVVLMFLFSVHTLTSIYQDIGRHIRLGGIIWSTGHIPSTNLFSYTAKDFPFINHHWLGEVTLYLGDCLFDLSGIILAKAVLVSLAFGLALAAAWRSRLAIPASLIGAVSVLIMVERTDVRPEVLSFVFLAWFLFVLYRKPHTRLIWTLPLVQLLWVNTHIYFFIGSFVILAWWVGELAQSGRSALKGRRHWFLAGLIASATLINPAGLTGALYPLHIFGNYGYSVMENKSPFFLATYSYPPMTSYALYVGLALTAMGFIINRHNLRRNLTGLILCVGSGILALMMVRNFPLFALVMLPATLRNLDQAGWQWRPRQAFAFVGAGMLLFAVGIVSNQIYNDDGLSGRQFGIIVPQGPQQPMDFYRKAGIKGPIFNNFDIGSFLIWKLPEEPVFIDGRPEAYPAGFIQDIYIKMQNSQTAWDKYSAQYGINAIVWGYTDITPWSQAFVARITQDKNWVMVYQGQGIMILVKNTPQNASIIAKYALH